MQGTKKAPVDFGRWSFVDATGLEPVTLTLSR